MYQVKITADVIDPEDPEYLRVNTQLTELAKEYGCVRRVDYIGSVEVGIFKFPTRSACMQFRHSKEHSDAMSRVTQFYRTMTVSRQSD